MIKINLLPFRAARKSENIRRQVSLFVLTLVFTLLVMGYFQIYLTSQVNGLKRQVESTNKDLQHYQKQAAEVDIIQKNLDTLQKRNDVMKELDKNRKAPVQFLDAMTRVVIPNRMWLKKLVISEANAKISGLAIDQKTTADFMVRLEESKLFTDVILETIKQEEISTIKQEETSKQKSQKQEGISKQKLQGFEITCLKPASVANVANVEKK